MTSHHLTAPGARSSQQYARFFATVGGLALCAALAPAPVQAQQNASTTAPQWLGRITYFTSRLPRPVLEVPATVTVIEGEDLHEQGVTDMQQLTRYVPGLTVNRQINAAQPFNDFDGFNMRGVGGNRVLTLIDGSRLPERIADGTRDYLDFSFIRQAEVVRGPASVVWGSDALGGVVALQTITAEDVLNGRDRGGETRTGYDSHTHTRTASVTFAQRLSDSLTVLVGASTLAANEPETSTASANGGLYSDIWGGCPRDLAAGATPCNQFDPTDIETQRGLVRLHWTPTTEHSFDFTADLMRRVTTVAFNQNLGLVTGSTDTVQVDERQQDLRRQRYALSHEWTPESGVVDSLTTTLSYAPGGYSTYRARRHVTGTGELVQTEDWLDYDEAFTELDIQGVRSFSLGGAEHALTFGFDGDVTETDYYRASRVWNQTTGSDVTTFAGGFNFANSTTTRADIYVQDRISLAGGRFELTPGLRYATYRISPRPNADYAVVPGSEPVARRSAELLGSLGARWEISPTWTLWSNIGQGFKMPTAQQLYTSLPGTFFDLVPAPDLLPEHVLNVEIGARAEAGWGYLSVSAFHADYSDFIQSFYNPPGTNDYTYRNISEREVWGIEFAGEYRLNTEWTLNGSLNWQRGVDRVTPASAETRADLRELSGVVGLNWQPAGSRWSMDSYLRFADGVKETASDTGFRPAGYGLVDLFARYELTETAVLSIGVTNLFDRAYFTDSAIGVTTSPTEAVARQNPLDLRLGSGREITVALQARF